MNLLSMDIELNQLDDMPKVIEIGAVAFKSHTGEILGTFHTYVYPHELITQYITNLTGITNDKVLGAPTINQAYYLLKDFHKKHRCFKNPVLWGSGTRNDADTIWQEAKAEEQNFMGLRVIDAKTLYQSLKIYQNGTIKGGLETACKAIGLEWDSLYGEPHRALADAYNTYRVWYNLMTRMNRGSP